MLRGHDTRASILKLAHYVTSIYKEGSFLNLAVFPRQNGTEQPQSWSSRNTCESAVTLTCQEKMHHFIHPSMNLREEIREEEMSCALISRKKSRD